MSTPARYPGGFTNRKASDPFKNLLLPDPTTMATYFNDFHVFAATDWVITLVEAGAGTPTQAIADGDGGILLLTNDIGAADATFLQSVGESWVFTPGKRIHFKTRIKVADALAPNIHVGLQIRDTTPADAADGVFFLKDAASTDLDIVVRKGGTGVVTTSVATVVDDTFIDLAFVYNGVDEVVFFVNGAAVLNSPVTNLPTTELTVSFGIKNSTTTAETMSLDYIMSAKER